MPKTDTSQKISKPSAKGRPDKRSEPQRHGGRRMTRDELTRHERETRAQRMVVMGFTGVLLLAVLILGFGWWRTYYARGNESVASVNGQTITLDAFAKRLDINRKNLDQQIRSMQDQYAANPGSPMASLFQQQIQQLQFTQALLPEQTVQQMSDELLVRQEATKRGITVSQDEIDQEIKNNFGDQATAVPRPSATPNAGATAGPAATPGPSPTPRPTADVQANVNNILLVYGMTRDELRGFMEYQVLYRKLQDAMAAEVPTSAEQVHARHILVDTEDKANAILARLKNGEKFEDVAKAESTDTGTKDKGGDLGWFPRGQMIPEFDAAAFSLPVNQLSDPIKTTYGYHIIQVLEKDPNRPFDPDVLAQKKNTAVEDWLSKARTGPDVKMTLNNDQKQWAYDKIKWTPPDLSSQLNQQPQPQPQQQPTAPAQPAGQPQPQATAKPGP